MKWVWTTNGEKNTWTKSWSTWTHESWQIIIYVKIDDTNPWFTLKEQIKDWSNNNKQDGELRRFVFCFRLKDHKHDNATHDEQAITAQHLFQKQQMAMAIGYVILFHNNYCVINNCKPIYNIWFLDISVTEINLDDSK